MPTADDFHSELMQQLKRAAQQGRPHVEINAGELHRVVGGYPGTGHRMPMCCDAMRHEMKRGRADVVHEPPSGKGAALIVRYHLPRP